MVNPIHVLHCFPSGLTVAAARHEAKKLLDNGQQVTLVAALNHIAMREMGVNWADALDKLSQVHAQNSPDTSGKGNDILAVQSTQQQTSESVASKEAQRDFLSELSATARASEKYTECMQAKVTMQMSLTDISRLMNQYPHIGYEGMLLQSMSPRDVQAQRDQLMVAVNECNLAYYFLKKCDTNKNINKKLDSAQLAHIATRYAQTKQMLSAEDALHEGPLMLAAYHLGLKVHLPKASQLSTERAFAQAFFNLSSRSELIKSLS